MKNTIATKAKILTTSVLTGLIMLGCATTTKSGVVGVDRSQMMLIDSKTMDQKASLAYTQTLRQATSMKLLNTDPIQTKRVKNISNRLIAQTGAFRNDVAKWKWEVNVLKVDEINAWCMPGGKIAVYTGLINKIQPTDDELAAVIGHEISHALREHSRENSSRQQVAGLGVVAVGLITGSEAAMKVANAAAQVGLLLPFSRTQEKEADLMGAELMARAGYNPQAAITLWQKMNKVAGDNKLAFLSTHPSGSSRIKNLQEIQPKVQPLYAAAPKAPAKSYGRAGGKKSTRAKTPNAKGMVNKALKG